jgi:YHS domain-containing protein
MYTKEIKVKSRFRQCLYPYAKYRTSGLFIYEGRATLNLLKSKYDSKGILYSRYLWEVSNKRKERKGYEIDHIDGDCTNDTLSNLQEISRSENRLKGTNETLKKNYKNSSRVFLWCPVCDKRFKRSRWRIDFNELESGDKFYFCSKECSIEAQHKNFYFPEKQKWKRIKKKEFVPKNKCEDFKEFSIPLFETKIVRYCDCGNKLNSRDRKYCCKQCIIKYGNNVNFKFEHVKDKLLPICKKSISKFGRYNYSWIGRKLKVSGKSVKKFINRVKV